MESGRRHRTKNAKSVSVCTGTNVMFDPDAPDWAHNEKSFRNVSRCKNDYC